MQRDLGKLPIVIVAVSFSLFHRLAGRTSATVGIARVGRKSGLYFAAQGV